jgi:predicted nucleic acid-binding protein
VALICDTGPLLAALDRDDPDHELCASLLAGSREDLVVPGLVLAELDYWCRKIGLEGAWLTFLEDVEAGAWRLAWPTPADIRRARELEQKYASLGLGVVDASIIALAERLNEPKIATLDRRYFTVIRPVHVPALQLLPEI